MVRGERERERWVGEGEDEEEEEVHGQRLAVKRDISSFSGRFDSNVDHMACKEEEITKSQRAVKSCWWWPPALEGGRTDGWCCCFCCRSLVSDECSALLRLHCCMRWSRLPAALLPLVSLAPPPLPIPSAGTGGAERRGRNGSGSGRGRAKPTEAALVFPMRSREGKESGHALDPTYLTPVRYWPSARQGKGREGKARQGEGGTDGDIYKRVVFVFLFISLQWISEESVGTRMICLLSSRAAAAAASEAAGHATIISSVAAAAGDLAVAPPVSNSASMPPFAAVSHFQIPRRSCKPQALGVMRNLALLEFAWLVPLGAMSACLELSCNATDEVSEYADEARIMMKSRFFHKAELRMITPEITPTASTLCQRGRGTQLGSAQLGSARVASAKFVVAEVCKNGVCSLWPIGPHGWQLSASQSALHLDEAECSLTQITTEGNYSELCIHNTASSYAPVKIAQAQHSVSGHGWKSVTFQPIGSKGDFEVDVGAVRLNRGRLKPVSSRASTEQNTIEQNTQASHSSAVWPRPGPAFLPIRNLTRSFGFPPPCLALPCLGWLGSKRGRSAEAEVRLEVGSRDECAGAGAGASIFRKGVHAQGTSASTAMQQQQAAAGTGRVGTVSGIQALEGRKVSLGKRGPTLRGEQEEKRATAAACT
ncbi:hypothetical protein AXG93_2528s1570 [Marchantia polymorpha subsp. ruderalis]|uniref:Uncharacterized protein n=1 Tax=Marchantia polymorpha subsp. ruderalis TaxID=1480154 RepID=A0A176WQ94_MARPO|nr:hypothetical protein AXG93_2528s1570 [Marchantia polymorpha subsp. ruderalis]